MCSAEGEGVGGAGGVDVEEVTMPEINCQQYLALRANCAHVLAFPVVPLMV